MKSIFKKSIELNQKIETFMNVISDGLLLTKKMVKAYLDTNETVFNETLERICILETEADNLELEIKTDLYKYMLLPDARADVLSLVKSMDNIIDNIEEFAKELKIQKPQFPSILHKDILELTEQSILANESLINANRAFFNEVHLINAHINKVKFYEHEADILEDQLCDMIFNHGLTDQLAEKLQLKFFINKIADVSDEAEVISEKLTIFAIKREI